MTAWEDAVTASHRTISWRAALVDRIGTEVQALDVASGTVNLRGDQAEQWSADLTLVDPALVPTGVDSPLWPWSGLLIRLWWRILTADGWQESLLCTLSPTKPTTDDDGTLSLSLTGRDVLADAARGGYGGCTLSLGGMTVSDALGAILGAVAPGRTMRMGETSVTLPTTYQVGERRPQDDWTEIAALAGWIVRTDRYGVIVCDAPPDPLTVAADWQEGPACRVSRIKREIDSDTCNVIVCTSTHAELPKPVTGIAQDDDEGSPTWVGRYGPYQDEISSDVATTVAACEALARAELRKRLLPQETVTITVPQRPDLDYLDRILLDRSLSGVAGEYRVQGWRLPIGSPSPMEVTMVARSVSL